MVESFAYNETIPNFATAFLIAIEAITKFLITEKDMIVVPVKEGENIEKALKKFKRKFEKTGVVNELRNRQAFTKPSVVKRKQRMRAIYVLKLQQTEE